MGGQRRAAVGVATATLFIVGALAGLAANSATGEAHWPGVLDLLRRQAWPSVGVLLTVGLLLTLLLLRLDRDPAFADDPPPPPPPRVEDWWVHRAEADAVVAALIRGHTSTIALTTALHGAGGFGKTRIALMACANRRVRRHFRDRIYLITIGRDIRSRAAIAEKITDATRLITGDTTAFTDPDMAGDHLGRLMRQRPRTLLVLDDIWEDDQLKPFERAVSESVALLITTRVPRLLSPGTARIQVDQMTAEEARRVLTSDLPALAEATVRDLLDATGCWPLLLRPTNRLIASEIATGLAPEVAARGVLHRLNTNGPTAVDNPGIVLDVAVPAEREKAVRATIEAATRLLPSNGGDRYNELGIFAEDESIPVTLITLLWESRGGLTPDQSRELCRALADLSLITLTPERGGRVTLHDVYRDYLRAELQPAGILSANADLIRAIETTLPPAAPLASPGPDPRVAWWEAPEGYVLDHATEHLVAAGHTDWAEAVATDIRWIEARLHQNGPLAPVNDLAHIPTNVAQEAAQDLTRAGHLLEPTDPPHALTSILHSRLQQLPQWTTQIRAWRTQSTHPELLNAWPLPDLPAAAFERALTGYSGAVSGVAISPDGTWLASARRDGTVNLWDRASGTCTATLIGHTDSVLGVAISPDGTWVASAGRATVRLWDRESGTCTATLNAHTTITAMAISPDGLWLATASHDKMVRLWDRGSGSCTATLTGHTAGVLGVAISPDGLWLATASHDKTVRLWDRGSGSCTATLTGHTDSVEGVAISPDGAWLATVSEDETVRLWDRGSGSCTATLTGHTRPVYAVAISPDGTWLASAGQDETVRLWDKQSGSCTAVLTEHT